MHGTKEGGRIAVHGAKASCVDKNGGDVLCMDKRKSGNLRHKATRRKLPELMQRYVESCRPPTGTDPKKGGGRLATFAGFCSFIGCGISDIEALSEEDPSIWEQLCATLEDEVLNHTPSPTLLLAYLKKRLHYADAPEGRGEAVKLLFEHDIGEDGA